MKTNLILLDFEIDKDDFKLLHALERRSNETWLLKCYANNYYKKIIRIITYFIFPFFLFLKRKKYNKILTFQQFFGIILAFYGRLFSIKESMNISIMTFIYKPKKGIIGKVYYKFMKYAIESKHVSNVICHATYETEFYTSLFKQKFEFCPFGIKDRLDDYIITRNYPDDTEHGYFLSCGRSNRDYDFLINAFRDLPFKLIIICDELNRDSTDNVEIYNDIKDDKYLEILSKSYGVIIPLLDKNISSGQMVFLESSMFGKPIIATRTNGLSDYCSCAALLINNNKEELKDALDQILDPDNYRQRSRDLREYFISNFTEDIMNQKIVDILYP